MTILEGRSPASTCPGNRPHQRGAPWPRDAKPVVAAPGPPIRLRRRCAPPYWTPSRNSAATPTWFASPTRILPPSAPSWASSCRPRSPPAGRSRSAFHQVHLYSGPAGLSRASRAASASISARRASLAPSSSITAVSTKRSMPVPSCRTTWTRCPTSPIRPSTS
jgi:hypothetical protein